MITREYIRKKLDVSEREGIIGSSSVGAVAGIEGRVTEYSVYRSFTGSKDSTDSDTQWTYDKGHILEEPTAKMFEKLTGLTLSEPDEAYVDADHPELICHPDREFSIERKGLRCALEIKTTELFAAKASWGIPEPVWDTEMPEDVTVYSGDGIPPQYYAQCQWYYAICGYDRVYLARFTDNEIFIYYVPENAEFGKKLYDSVLEWIESVKNGYVPSPSTPGEIRLAYPKETKDTCLVADNSTMEIFRALQEETRKKKDAEAKIDDLKAKLALYMKDNEILVSNKGDKLLSFGIQKTQRIDTKRLRLEMPDIADDYSYMTESRVLKVIPRKDV